MNYKFSNYWVFYLFLCSFFALLILLPNQVTAENGEKIGVKIMEKEMVGSYLADSNGMTLYYYKKDANMLSNCIEGCAVNWPPFYSDQSTVSDGLDPKNLKTIKRSDNRLQTTYKGMPLYYFKNDKYPGDIFGSGLGDSWFLVAP